MNVLIAGATGYLGIVFIKILKKQKKVKIKYLCGNSSVGKKITDFDKSIKYNLPLITKITKSKPTYPVAPATTMFILFLVINNLYH